MASDGLQLIFAILLLALGILVAVSGMNKLGGGAAATGSKA